MVSIPRTEFSPEELKRLDSLRSPADKDVGLVEACSQSVVVFAHYMLGMKLYYWQIRFLESMQNILEGKDTVHDRVLALTSRQIGKSASLAVFALWASFFNKRPDKRFHSTTVVMVSRSDTQAKKLLREMKKTYNDGDIYMRWNYLDSDGNSIFWYPKNKRNKQGFFSSRLSDDDPNNASMINWRTYDETKDGEFILKNSRSSCGASCYPPTDVVLGETFTIGMVDEAAHEKITDVFWKDSLKKTGDANQALWIFTSTPWKPSGFFYDYCDVEERGTADYVDKLCFTIDTLKYDIESGLHINAEGVNLVEEHYNYVQDEIEKDLALGGVSSVKKGYYCEFVSGDTTYFNPDHVMGMFDKNVVMVEQFSKPCDLAIDFAGSPNGHSTFTVAYYDEEKDTVVRLWHKRFDKGASIDFIAEVKAVMRNFNIQRIIPDDCPAGFHHINQMTKDMGWNVTPMQFRTWKVKKYGGFRALLAKKRIVSYPDELLKEEMLAMEYSQSTKQSYIQPSMGKTDDLIDGFVMSAFHYLDGEERVTFVSWEDADDEW